MKRILAVGTLVVMVFVGVAAMRPSNFQVTSKAPPRAAVAYHVPPSPARRNIAVEQPQPVITAAMDPVEANETPTGLAQPAANAPPAMTKLHFLEAAATARPSKLSVRAAAEPLLIKSALVPSETRPAEVPERVRPAVLPQNAVLQTDLPPRSARPVEVREAAAVRLTVGDPELVPARSVAADPAAAGEWAAPARPAAAAQNQFSTSSRPFSGAAREYSVNAHGLNPVVDVEQLHEALALRGTEIRSAARADEAAPSAPAAKTRLQLLEPPTESSVRESLFGSPASASDIPPQLQSRR